MKNFYTSVILIVVTFAFSEQSFGQLKMSGEVRPRTEYRHGYKTLVGKETQAALFTDQRTRINLDYTMESIKFLVSFQDIRVWGGTSQLNMYDDYLALHQAWAEILFTKEMSLKLGRQELNYDDQRIFGNVGWAQQARSHDIGLFKYENDFKLHLGFAYNQDKAGLTGQIYNNPKNYKAMQFAWFNKKYDDSQISLLALNNGLQHIKDTIDKAPSTIRYSQTLGTYLKLKPMSKISLDASFYYQLGKDVSNNNISAYQTSLNVKVKVSDAIGLLAGTEILSGTSYDVKSEGGTNNSFNPFYGTNHKFNGLMDYFYVGNHGYNVGLNDFSVGAVWKNAKWKTVAKAHYFMSNAEIGKDISSDLGTEVDLILVYKYNELINFTAGYSQMFATESMEKIKGSIAGSMKELNNWAFLMVTIKPMFLNTGLEK